MKQHRITVAAGGILEVNAVGDFVRVQSSTGALVIELDSGDVVPITVGQKLRLPERFDRLIIRNTGASSVTAELLIGFGDFDDRQVTGSVQVAPSGSLAAVADVSLAAGSATLILAADSNRDEAVISNPASNSQTMRIGGASAGASAGIPLPPGATLILSTTAAIYGYNPGAAAESVAVGVLS